MRCLMLSVAKRPGTEEAEYMLVRYGCVWERFGSCIGCAILIEAVREKHGPPY